MLIFEMINIIAQGGKASEKDARCEPMLYGS